MGLNILPLNSDLPFGANLLTGNRRFF